MSAFPLVARPAVGALLLLLGATAAQANDATMIAKRAGFLVGQGHRCGVADARLARSAAVAEAVIAAFSSGDDEREAAQAEFARRALAAAQAGRRDDPVPSCAAIRAALLRLIEHRAQPAARLHERERREMATDDRSAASPPRRRAATAKAVTAAKSRTTTRREELTPERRAALEQQRAARRQRGRPPSI